MIVGSVEFSLRIGKESDNGIGGEESSLLSLEQWEGIEGGNGTEVSSRVMSNFLNIKSKGINNSSDLSVPVASE